MINTIKLKNFKSFKKSGQIDIGKINIFVGPNSSGKSSFIQGLLLLKNSIQCAIEKQYKNLDGDYKALVYDNDIHNKIEYKISFTEQNGMKDLINLEQIYEGFPDIAEDDADKIINSYKQLSLKDLSVTLEIIDDKMFKTDDFEINTFKVTTKEDLEIMIYRKEKRYSLELNGKVIENIDVENKCKFYFKLNQTKLTGLSQSVKDEIMTAYAILEKLESTLVGFSNKLIYMASLRTDFLRSQDVAEYKRATSVGSRGQRTLDTLMEINRSCDDDSDINHKKEQIDHWLDEFDLGDKIEVKKLKNEKYSIMIRNKYLDIYNNILDVGIGTSQLLPIIIESVNSKNESLVIIEEPETHIHPKAQAKLADLFVGCANSDNKRFMIETHSIFLVTQLQILVASGAIAAEDVKVYYFDQDREGTKIKDMVLTENGQFEEEWPSGFFDIHYELGRKLFELM